MADQIRVTIGGVEYEALIVYQSAGGADSPNVAEDTAAASGDVGTRIMAVQTASPADAATAGDYAMLQMSGGALWVKRRGPGTATQTSVDSVTTAGGVNILAANTARQGAIITNTDANALYLYYGATGTVSSSIFNHKLLTDQSLILEPGDHTGVITGIWAADGSGAAKVVEFT